MTTPEEREPRQGRKRAQSIDEPADTITLTLSYGEAYLFAAHIAKGLQAWKAVGEENHQDLLERASRNALRVQALRIFRQIPEEQGYGKLDIPE